MPQQNRQTVFVKVSGDLFTSKQFLAGIDKLARDFFVVICVGGGTQINEAFRKIGIEPGPHGPLGREAQTFKEKQLARDVLERNRDTLQDLLAAERIPAEVIIPVLDIGSVLCHVNGDQMVRTVYLGFDKIFIATTPDRREKKIIEFASLPKVQIMVFDQ